jgi:hypothetical protein
LSPLSAKVNLLLFGMMLLLVLRRRGKAYLDNSDSHVKKVIVVNIKNKINLTTLMSAAQAKTGIARTVIRTAIGERYTTHALHFFGIELCTD